MQIRLMTASDLRDVLEIERASFDQEWNRTQFMEFMREINAVGMVAEVAISDYSPDNVIIGFYLFRINKHHYELVSIAVDSAFQRESVGQRMLLALAATASRAGRSCIQACVRETNLDAQLFFANCGYMATWVDRGYYEDTGEDGYQFVFETMEQSSNQGRSDVLRNQ